ncbi:hypothetical protein C0J52_09549 [Blattella germanica]|nr:hypothetical protein C0J52_09549 [Blattella germanica]
MTVQMDKIIQLLLLLLILFLQIVMMTSLQMMMCLEEIITRNFPSGEVIVFSLPSNVSDTEPRHLHSTHDVSDDITFINSLIAQVNDKTKWPLVISPKPQSVDAIIPEPQQIINYSLRRVWLSFFFANEYRTIFEIKG